MISSLYHSLLYKSEQFRTCFCSCDLRMDRRELHKIQRLLQQPLCQRRHLPALPLQLRCLPVRLSPGTMGPAMRPGESLLQSTVSERSHLSQPIGHRLHLPLPRVALRRPVPRGQRMRLVHLFQRSHLCECFCDAIHLPLPTIVLRRFLSALQQLFHRPVRQRTLSVDDVIG